MLGTFHYRASLKLKFFFFASCVSAQTHYKLTPSCAREAKIFFSTGEQTFSSCPETRASSFTVINVFGMFFVFLTRESSNNWNAFKFVRRHSQRAVAFDGNHYAFWISIIVPHFNLNSETPGKLKNVENVFPLFQQLTWTARTILLDSIRNFEKIRAMVATYFFGFKNWISEIFFCLGRWVAWTAHPTNYCSATSVGIMSGTASNGATFCELKVQLFDTNFQMPETA